MADASVSQSPSGGRSHAALRSPDSQPGVSGSNPLNAGERDTDGSWSPQQPSFSWFFCPLRVSIDTLLPQSLQRKSPACCYCSGAWNRCERRRRIIRRLQLIFSPRFSSGKEKLAAVFDTRWMERALLCESLWPLHTECPLLVMAININLSVAASRRELRILVISYFIEASSGAEE